MRNRYFDGDAQIRALAGRNLKTPLTITPGSLAAAKGSLPLRPPSGIVKAALTYSRILRTSKLSQPLGRLKRHPTAALRDYQYSRIDNTARLVLGT